MILSARNWTLFEIRVMKMRKRSLPGTVHRTSSRFPDIRIRRAWALTGLRDRKTPRVCQWVHAQLQGVETHAFRMAVAFLVIPCIFCPGRILNDVDGKDERWSPMGLIESAMAIRNGSRVVTAC